MKSSFGKLRRFASLQRIDTREKLEFFPPAHLHELAQASKDMQAMKNCYDSLLSAAAATANSAYEFSESLQEMGTCLMEKTAIHADEESGRLLSMLGNVQLELQKLVDTYRSHIFVTITDPSDSFLNELRNVEEMKKQCDEKRDAYEYMLTQQREKGKSKSGKGENFAFQQLQSAHEEYIEEANLCVFRLKSLKQGQSRSLLTQAARHHMAQLNFFRKGLESLEEVDSHVKRIAEKLHIDYQLSVIEGEVEDREDSYNKKEGELNFDYKKSTGGVEVSASGNSTEVDHLSLSYPAQSTEVKANIERIQSDSHFLTTERMNSHSAPIFAEKKFVPAEKARQVPNSYVLPTPSDGKSLTVPHTKSTESLGANHNLSHSSPLEQKKHQPRRTLDLKDGKSYSFSQLPPPLSDGLLPDIERFKRQASFSGPMTTKPVSNKPVLSTSGSELPQSSSAQPSSPRVSPTASPPLVSSPRIGELHELPRPPNSKPIKPSGLVGHSAPLVFRNHDPSSTSYKIPSTASPLPAPPLIYSRSFSIPSSSQRATAKILEPTRFSSIVEEVTSPPLMPISLANMKPVTSIAAAVSQSSPITGSG